MAYSFQLRMCFQDVDGEGIVYHANYLNYAERARTEWMAKQGLTNQQVMDSGIAFVLRHAEIDFISPAKLDDIISIDIRIKEIKNASVLMEQNITVDGNKKVTISLQLAFVDTKTLRPTRIPPDMKQIFINGQEGE
jgi:acyl-CoA thioester hydrolase